MVTKSLDPLARASASAVNVKQLPQSISPTARPEVIGVLAQPTTGTTGLTYNKPLLASGVADDAGVRFGFGSPLHLAAKKLFPRSRDGAKVDVYYIPIEDAVGGVASAGNITISGTATATFQAFITTYELEIEAAADACGKIATNAQLNPAKAPRGIDLNGYNINNIPFVVAINDTAGDIITKMKAAISEYPEVPYTVADGAGDDIDLTMKWEGPQGNGIVIDVVDANGNTLSSTSGITATVTSFASGAGVPTLTSALDELTEEFGFTRIVSFYNDTTSLDAIQQWGEGLRDPLVAQYAISYHGLMYPESGSVSGTVDVAALVAIGNARKDDAVNSVVVGSYGQSLRALTYSQRDQLVKAGISNFELQSTGNYRIGDIVTFYHPDGLSNPLFAFDRDVTLIGNIAYDQVTYFRLSEEWKSVILIGNDDVSVNPAARSTDDIKAAVNKRLELYGIEAWIANVADAQENTIVEIDTGNPNRVNINIFAELSGVARIIDVTNFLGFFFGN